jgi:hypothetical protein
MATKEKEVEGVVSFIVTEPLKHNGVDYQIGETVELSEKDARVLLDLEVVQSVVA